MGRFSRAEPVESLLYFMTKQSLIDRLKSARDWNHYRNDSKNWEDAFLFYNASHGLDGKERLRMSCSRCFQTVRDWLEK